MTGLSRVGKAVVGLVVLTALAGTVYGWYGQYKQATRKTLASSEASSSVQSTRVVPVAGGKKVAILVDGLVLRATPSAGAASVRTLKKGEQLILVGAAGTWLQLRDSRNGKIGYVVNSTVNLQVQK